MAYVQIPKDLTKVKTKFMLGLAVIADTSRIHIEANIAETDITRLAVGKRVYVTIDPFGSQQFTGYIAEIGRITNAELTGQAI